MSTRDIRSWLYREEGTSWVPKQLLEIYLLFVDFNNVPLSHSIVNCLNHYLICILQGIGFFAISVHISVPDSAYFSLLSPKEP